MYQKLNGGAIEVITGPMFSGKSEEALRRYRLLVHAQKRVALVQPQMSTREHENEVRSRSGTKAHSFALKKAQELLALAQDYDAFVIDEAQFFDAQLPEIVSTLANQGKFVIVSGLDQSFERKPFMNMAILMSLAEKVTKLYAICVRCSHMATTTFRTTNDKAIKVIGDREAYEARCRACHLKAHFESK